MMKKTWSLASTFVELSVVDVGFFDDGHEAGDARVFAVAVVEERALAHSHAPHEVAGLKERKKIIGIYEEFTFLVIYYFDLKRF